MKHDPLMYLFRFLVDLKNKFLREKNPTLGLNHVKMKQTCYSGGMKKKEKQSKVAEGFFELFLH